MTFLKQVKLYRVKITEPCDKKNILQKTLNLNYTLNNSGIGYREFKRFSK
ncbi:hypothetical protein [Clostridium beijerinckii]|nr:hypothetical protein [Clostridium beijerinckii]